MGLSDEQYLNKCCEVVDEHIKELTFEKIVKKNKYRKELTK